MNSIIFKEKVWIHLDRQGYNFGECLQEIIGDKPAILSVLRENTNVARPKLVELNNDEYLLTLRLPIKDNSMATLRVYANGERVISVRGRVIPFIADASPELLDYNSCLKFILKGVTDAFESWARETESELDKTEMIYNRKIKRLSMEKIRRRVNIVLRDIRTQVRVYDLCDDKNAFEAATRAFSDINALSDRVATIMAEMDGYEDRIAASNLYKLSILSAIFLPPSFITGLFGVNLQGMPFVQNTPHAWYYLCIGLFLMSLALIVLMFRIGFIRK